MPFRDDLLTPIGAANPSGSNLRYDPIADAIKEARREDLDLAQGAWKTALKTADYRQVIKLAGEALAKRSKDLQLAVWLVDAQVRVEGFASLAPGFSFLRHLLEQFWDTLYPELEDGDLELRAAPLDWLGNKLEGPLVLLPITSSGLSFAAYKQSRTIGYERDAVTSEKQALRQNAIREGKTTAEDFDDAVNATSRQFYDSCQNALAAALEELQSLSELCDERFGNAAPSFLKTRTALESIGQQIRIFLNKKGPAPSAASAPSVSAPVPPAPEPVNAPTPPVPRVETPPPTPVPAVAAPPVQPVNTGSTPSGLSDVISRLAVICRYLRESTIYDASAYLVLRSMRWGELRAKAPNIEPEMLQAPPLELRQQLKDRFSARDWDGVLNLTESAMELPCGRAWLDLQRYTVQALEQQGEYFAGVARSIKLALRALLEEFPDLLEHCLTDETPVANTETRTWINEEILSGASASPPRQAKPVEAEPARPAEPEPQVVQSPLASSPPQLEPDEDQAIPDLFEQALEAANANRTGEAVQLITRQLAAERSGRARFRRRAQLAHLLMTGGHKHVALPILERLVDEMEQRHLEDWERSEALAYPVDLLIRCLDANGADPEQRKHLYARLCQLDPARALRSIIT